MSVLLDAPLYSLLLERLFHALLSANIEQDWILLQMVFGVAVIRGSSSMSKCLILMLPLTRSLVCLHCIADL